MSRVTVLCPLLAPSHLRFARDCYERERLSLDAARRPLRAVALNQKLLFTDENHCGLCCNNSCVYAPQHFANSSSCRSSGPSRNRSFTPKEFADSRSDAKLQRLGNCQTLQVSFLTKLSRFRLCNIHNSNGIELRGGPTWAAGSAALGSGRN